MNQGNLKGNEPARGGLKPLRGFEFNNSSISTSTVYRTSSETTFVPRTTCNAVLMDRISLSQEPPKWGEYGGLRRI